MGHKIDFDFQPNDASFFGSIARHRGERPRRWFFATDSTRAMGVGLTPAEAVLDMRNEYRTFKKAGNHYA
jgi:hypothetical protein